jgi:hypothetical protein
MTTVALGPVPTWNRYREITVEGKDHLASPVVTSVFVSLLRSAGAVLIRQLRLQQIEKLASAPRFDLRHVDLDYLYLSKRAIRTEPQVCGEGCVGRQPRSRKGTVWLVRAP